VIETANEPSPSVKPVTNQGFNLNPSLCIKDLIFFVFNEISPLSLKLPFVIIVVVVFVFVEYKCLFKI